MLPPPVGASDRAPAALRLPADFRCQSCVAASRGTPRGPPPRRRRRPFRPPRGKAQSAAPLFYLSGVFARALARSLAFPFSRSFSFFSSFRSPVRALFPLAPPALARSRPSSCWAPRSGAAGSSPRPPPPALRRRRRRRRSALRLIPIWHGRRAHAPAPPHHPRSSRQPAPLAPHAWRPPAWPPRTRPLVFPHRWAVAGGEAAADWGRGVSSAASCPSPTCPQPTTCSGHPRGRGARQAAAPPAPDGAATPRCLAPTGRRAPRDPAPILSLLQPTREGPPRLTSGCGQRPGNRVASLCRFWRSEPGEARCCRPHVTASGKMALAEERTERQLDTRSARVAVGEGCVRPPGPRRRRGATLEIWEGTQVPPVCEVRPGPPAHPMSLGFRRRCPVNPSFPAARGPGEGAQDGCRIPAGVQGARGRDRSSKVATSQPRNPRWPRALCSPSLPLPQRGQVPVGHPYPHLLWRVPCSKESLRRGDPGVPGLPGPGRRSPRGL